MCVCGGGAVLQTAGEWSACSGQVAATKRLSQTARVMDPATDLCLSTEDADDGRSVTSRRQQQVVFGDSSLVRLVALTAGVGNSLSLLHIFLSAFPF